MWILRRVINDLLATVAFVLIVAGWTQRRRRERHVPLVLSGIGLDLALVVWLEVSRGVVEEVAGTREHVPFPTLRWVHIATSTLAVVLYLPTMWFGFRLPCLREWWDGLGEDNLAADCAAYTGPAGVCGGGGVSGVC